ncbi:hypothetical protein QAD02_002600 [Eretmocerus hayati]|uniref:Uncharacterized protein n=1 Tax=Eretmocerus hayati TaxID=131215 RepID=A0ACC2NKB7_9HYME|nr:hypothetical protein QAD02_002600 [Eretmocerus hayati]
MDVSISESVDSVYHNDNLSGGSTKKPKESSTDDSSGNDSEKENSDSEDEKMEETPSIVEQAEAVNQPETVVFQQPNTDGGIVINVEEFRHERNANVGHSSYFEVKPKIEITHTIIISNDEDTRVDIPLSSQKKESILETPSSSSGEARTKTEPSLNDCEERGKGPAADQLPIASGFVKPETKKRKTNDEAKSDANAGDQGSAEPVPEKKKKGVASKKTLKESSASTSCEKDVSRSAVYKALQNAEEELANRTLGVAKRGDDALGSITQVLNEMLLQMKESSLSSALEVEVSNSLVENMATAIVGLCSALKKLMTFMVTQASN